MIRVGSPTHPHQHLPDTSVLAPGAGAAAATSCCWRRVRRRAGLARPGVGAEEAKEAKEASHCSCCRCCCLAASAPRSTLPGGGRVPAATARKGCCCSAAASRAAGARREWRAPVCCYSCCGAVDVGGQMADGRKACLWPVTA